MEWAKLEEACKRERGRDCFDRAQNYNEWEALLELHNEIEKLKDPKPNERPALDTALIQQKIEALNKINQ